MVRSQGSRASPGGLRQPLTPGCRVRAGPGGPLEIVPRRVPALRSVTVRKPGRRWAPGELLPNFGSYGRIRLCITCSARGSSGYAEGHSGPRTPVMGELHVPGACRCSWPPPSRGTAPPGRCGCRGAAPERMSGRSGSVRPAEPRPFVVLLDGAFGFCRAIRVGFRRPRAVACVVGRSGGEHPGAGEACTGGRELGRGARSVH